MSIGFYLSRIRESFDCSDACAVFALVFIDRAARHNPDLALNELTCHRLLLTCIMVAAKFHDDTCYRTEHYATVGCLEAGELVTLEEELVRALGWRLYLTPDQYQRCKDEMASEALMAWIQLLSDR
jgi:hypothetical protein